MAQQEETASGKRGLTVAQNGDRPSVSNATTGPVNAKETWARKPPAQLDDYTCYTTRAPELVSLV